MGEWLLGARGAAAFSVLLVVVTWWAFPGWGALAAHGVVALATLLRAAEAAKA